MYVRHGLGAPGWLNSILDVAGEAGAAVAESYGGKMAGDGVRAAHKIWTGMALKDNKGGGGRPPPPRPPAAPARSASGMILGPPSGPPGAMPPPPPAWRPRPRAKVVSKKKVTAALIDGPPSGPAAVEAGVMGGGGSKGMMIFGVISAVAIGAYLLMQNKKPTTPHEPRP